MMARVDSSDNDRNASKNRWRWWWKWWWWWWWLFSISQHSSIASGQQNKMVNTIVIATNLDTVSICWWESFQLLQCVKVVLNFTVCQSKSAMWQKCGLLILRVSKRQIQAHQALVHLQSCNLKIWHEKFVLSFFFILLRRRSFNSFFQGQINIYTE